MKKEKNKRKRKISKETKISDFWFSLQQKLTNWLTILPPQYYENPFTCILFFSHEIHKLSFTFLWFQQKIREKIIKIFHSFRKVLTTASLTKQGFWEVFLAIFVNSVIVLSSIVGILVLLHSCVYNLAAFTIYKTNLPWVFPDPLSINPNKNSSFFSVLVFIFFYHYIFLFIIFTCFINLPCIPTLIWSTYSIYIFFVYVIYQQYILFIHVLS